MRPLAVLAAAGAFAGAVGVPVALHLTSRPGASPQDSRSSLLVDVQAQLRDRYVRVLDADQLAAATLPGLLRRLNDPYTVYLSPDEYSTMQTGVTARYGGVGLRLTPGARPLRVVGTLRGSPAADAGLGHGDCVLTIDGIPTRRIAFASAVARLQGPPRSSVVLRVLHRGTTRPVVVRLLREELAPRSVMTHDIIRRGHLVRVIRVATFARGVGAAVRRAARGAKAVVLDLRGDPGGLLDEAIATTNVFLHSGRIVSWRGAHVPSQSLDAAGNALPRMPLAVLVDRDTASAAEIVAAALQEHRRAIVIGDRTFGKATLQEVAPLPSGGALKLTIATFLTPLGHDLHHRGVQPDVAGGGDPVSRALVAVRA